MADILQETVTSQQRGPTSAVRTESVQLASKTQTIEYSIYFVLGVVGVLLGFRMLLKFAGASLSSSFVGLIYNLTGLMILPFEGIFRRGLNQGLETTSVFEPATLVAMVVYAALAWGIVRMIQIMSREQQPAGI